jgi:PhnB protein
MHWAEGGTVHMPLGETFWADAFGMCTDRFGTPWGVNGGSKPMPAR